MSALNTVPPAVTARKLSSGKMNALITKTATRDRNAILINMPADSIFSWSPRAILPITQYLQIG